MTSVLLVDDHPLVRAGLRALLGAADDIEVVAEAGDGRDAVEQARRTSPDVVLMDLSMPGTDGVQATRALRLAVPGAAVVVLSSFHDSSRIQAALQAGAVGYLLKDCLPAELLAGVRAAARGHAPIDPRVAVQLLPNPASDAEESLSARERQVLELVARGWSNRQIGRELGIAERTVKVHLGNVFRRIGVLDRTSAALWARDHLDLPGTSPNV